MGTPNPDFRENCDRSIYVCGTIDQELVDKLTPVINKLRLPNPSPITAYVDSRGGSIRHAEVIRNLISAPNPDGKKCRLITVVTGTAASAAADFLTLGDYAIAYPNSEILYHGTRHLADFALTYEGATSLATSLHQTNEYFAIRLARCAFPRLVLRVLQLKDEFHAYLKDPNLMILAKALENKLLPSNTALVNDALKRQKNIALLTVSVSKHLKKFKNPSSLPDAKFQAEIAKAILNYKLKVHQKEKWDLSEIGMQEIAQDFALLHDFHFGSQTQQLQRWINVYGELFLIEEEGKEYKALTLDAKGKQQWLAEKTARKLQPLWYFIVSVCRLLQTADYALQATEAYWIGLVDEVPGSGLVNLREIIENQPVAAPKTAGTA